MKSNYILTILNDGISRLDCNVTLCDQLLNLCILCSYTAVQKLHNPLFLHTGQVVVVFSWSVRLLLKNV